ncbi:DnaE-like DNA polymerase III alpha [Microbacterium phage Sparcetus]|nr:DnaE-like DNA polymerase III alpha [Microbacterium phage Sparcetus]
MRYVSLHGHSTFSYMDGYGLPEHHVERVAELGMSAVALTEHGNVSSHVKLEQAALKHNIKPVFGLEAYTAMADMRETQNQRKWHQTMLAMDLHGYQNLMKMVTRSWADDFYRWPTVVIPNLQDNNEGIICTSGCTSGHLATQLIGGKGLEPNYEKAVKVLKAYKRMLGDRFYLEVQRFPGLEESRLLNQQYAIWSKEFKVPLLATSDVHYPRPEQNEMQKILHAAGRNTGTVAAAESEWEYDILLTYPSSDKEILDDLVGTGLSKRDAMAAIDNTVEVASRCNVELPKMDRIRYPGSTDDLKPWPSRTPRSGSTPTAGSATPADTSAPAAVRRRRTSRRSASSR